MFVRRAVVALAVGSLVLLSGGSLESAAEHEGVGWCADCGFTDCEVTNRDAYAICDWGPPCEVEGECDGVSLTPTLPDGTYLVGWQPTREELRGDDRWYRRDCQGRIVGRIYSESVERQLRAESARIVI